MNKDNAKDYLPLVQAWAEGKTLEFKTPRGWETIIDTPFDVPLDFYRIKPEPREGWALEYASGRLSSALFSTEEKAAECLRPGERSVKFREVIE